jgi:hypothetical protein
VVVVERRSGQTNKAWAFAWQKCVCMSAWRTALVHAGQRSDLAGKRFSRIYRTCLLSSTAIEIAAELARCGDCLAPPSLAELRSKLRDVSSLSILSIKV